MESTSQPWASRVQPPSAPLLPGLLGPQKTLTELDDLVRTLRDKNFNSKKLSASDKKSLLLHQLVAAMQAAPFESEGTHEGATMELMRHRVEIGVQALTQLQRTARDPRNKDDLTLQMQTADQSEKIYANLRGDCIGLRNAAAKRATPECFIAALADDAANGHDYAWFAALVHETKRASHILDPKKRELGDFQKERYRDLFDQQILASFKRDRRSIRAALTQGALGHDPMQHRSALADAMYALRWSRVMDQLGMACYDQRAALTNKDYIGDPESAVVQQIVRQAEVKLPGRQRG